jgi:hypothetical protein
VERAVNFSALPWSIIGVCLLAAAWFVLLRRLHAHSRKSDGLVSDEDKSSRQEAPGVDQRKEDP